MKKTYIGNRKLVGNFQRNITPGPPTAGPAISYNCSKNVCIDPGTGSGTYQGANALANCIAAGCQFSPEESKSKIVLWLKSRESDIQITTHPIIDKWSDTQSGSGKIYNAGNNLDVNTRPTYDNATEYVMFDGGDWLRDTIPQTIQLSTVDDGGWAIAFSAALEDYTTQNLVCGEYSGSMGCGLMFVNTGTAAGQMQIVLNDGSVNQSGQLTIGTLQPTKPAVFILNMNSAGLIRLYVDGVLRGSHTFSSDFDFKNLDTLGKFAAAPGIVGGVKEYIVYQNELSTADLSHLNDYLQTDL